MNKLRFIITVLIMLFLMILSSCQGSDKITSILRISRSVKVDKYTKISQTSGNFPAPLDSCDWFGNSVCSTSDLNNDGVIDLAVGAMYDDDGGVDRGAVWILFLNSDSSVKSYQKISDTEGNFDGALDDGDNFGRAVAYLGDLDSNGAGDIAVGAYWDDDGGSNRGAVWILFLNNDGSVKSYQKISDTQGNFDGNLSNDDCFGTSVSSIGDLNSDGVTDIAIGAFGDNDGGLQERGAVWILFLNSDGTVKSEQKISDTQGNFDGNLSDDDFFGTSVSSIGDLNGDGVTDIAVGAYWDDDGGTNRGAVWILFLNNDGSVKSYQKISDTEGNFNGTLDDSDRFGWSVSSIGDLNGDGVTDITVGAYCDDDGGTNKGAVWVLFLNNDGTVKSYQKISDTEGNFEATFNDSDYFGGSICSLGDFNNDGINDIVVGVYADDDGGTNKGAVYSLFLHRVY